MCLLKTPIAFSALKAFSIVVISKMKPHQYRIMREDRSVDAVVKSLREQCVRKLVLVHCVTF